MEYSVNIRPARATSLHDVLDDDGLPMRWTRKRWARAAAQIAMGESFEIEVDGVLAALGGFVPDTAPNGEPLTQVWLFTGSALSDRRLTRTAIDAMNAVLDVANERHGELICLTRADLPKAQKLTRLCGFELPLNGIGEWLVGRRFFDGAETQKELAA